MLLNVKAENGYYLLHIKRLKMVIISSTLTSWIELEKWQIPKLDDRIFLPFGMRLGGVFGRIGHEPWEELAGLLFGWEPSVERIHQSWIQTAWLQSTKHILNNLDTEMEAISAEDGRQKEQWGEDGQKKHGDPWF